MKGVLLTGGTGTRLKPHTDFINKHLLAVAGRPMVEYPLDTLLAAGVNEVFVIYNDPRIMYLDSKYDNLTYIYQPSPSGIAQAVFMVKPCISNEEDFLVLLGDNYFRNTLKLTRPTQIWASEIPDRGLTVLGAYYFDKRFFDVFPTTHPSARGEYEMVSILSGIGCMDITEVKPEDWVDMGTIEGIKQAESMEKCEPRKL